MKKFANKPNEFELAKTPLKECPFCDSREFHFIHEGKFIRLVCNKCNCHGPIRDCRLNAMYVWNQRAIKDR